MTTYKIINGKGYSVIQVKDIEIRLENKALDAIHQISNLLMLKKYNKIADIIKSIEVEIE